MATDKMYDLAFQYKGTKLWQQFYDDELFAVKLADGEVGYCCVMGMIGEHNALAVYVGDKGYQSYCAIRNADQDHMTDQMMGELLTFIESVKNPYLKKLLKSFFEEDGPFIKTFVSHSAAKTVHHGFIGGLMEHTLSVTRLCEYMAGAYPVIKRDLLITAALLHDVGKTRELSSFPLNDYTDEGQLLGHIVIGAQMIHDLAKEIPGFPVDLENQLVHCILAHHGELEYGSPKKPALVEAVALNLADNTDARMETLTEVFAADKGKKEWLGFNRIFDSNLRRTGDM